MSGVVISGGTSVVAYGAGKMIQGLLDQMIKPNWKWIDTGMGISKPLPLSPAPEIIGNIGSSIDLEGAGDLLQKRIKPTR